MKGAYFVWGAVIQGDDPLDESALRFAGVKGGWFDYTNDIQGVGSTGKGIRVCMRVPY